MTEAGLLEAGDRGRRDRRPFAVTGAGRAVFSAWIDRGPSPATIRIPLLLTVLFGRHLPPERLATFLAHHRGQHVERLAHYDDLRTAATTDHGEPDPYAMAVLDFGRCYERAVLEWFAELPAELLGEPSAVTAP